MRLRIARIIKEALLGSPTGITHVEIQGEPRVHASDSVELRVFRKPTMEDLEEDLDEDHPGKYRVTDELMTYEQVCEYYRTMESDVNRFWYTITIENDADMG